MALVSNEPSRATADNTAGTLAWGHSLLISTFLTDSGARDDW